MKIQLNASEIANLWTTCMNNLMYVSSIPYYMKKCEDEEIRSIIREEGWWQKAFKLV